MPNGTRHRSRLLVAFALAGVGAAGAAGATIYTYDFTADLNTATTSSGYGGSFNYYNIFYTAPLTNTATGLNSVPAITLNTGDTIDGTISLSSPWTIPASNWGDSILISLQNLDNPDTAGVEMNESVSLFDNGVPVSVPAAFGTFFESSGALQIELGMTGFGPTTTAPFTFNQIDFSGTLTGAYNSNIEDVSSATLDSANPYLWVDVAPLSTAPSPATPWLMLPGLLGIWAALRLNRGSRLARRAA
jgi:hypothetical protein